MAVGRAAHEQVACDFHGHLAAEGEADEGEGLVEQTLAAQVLGEPGGVEAERLATAGRVDPGWDDGVLEGLELRKEEVEVGSEAGQENEARVLGIVHGTMVADGVGGIPRRGITLTDRRFDD